MGPVVALAFRPLLLQPSNKELQWNKAQVSIMERNCATWLCNSTGQPRSAGSEAPKEARPPRGGSCSAKLRPWPRAFASWPPTPQGGILVFLGGPPPLSTLGAPPSCGPSWPPCRLCMSPCRVGWAQHCQSKPLRDITAGQNAGFAVRERPPFVAALRT